MDSRLTRRGAVRAACLTGVGLLATACARPFTPASAKAGLTLGAGGLLAAVPHLMASYAALRPQEHWVLPSPFHGQYAMLAPTRFNLWTPVPWDSEALTWEQEPLDQGLRRRNFDPAVLQPGLASAFSWRGGTYALPLMQYPWAIQWRADVFEAAGLPPPAADWTLDDFTAVCTELQGYARSGAAPAIHAPLGPLAGQKFLWIPPDSWDADVGLGTWGLWAGFAVGFGGSTAANGLFRLTDPATVEGMGRLVDLAARFALPPLTMKGPPMTSSGLPSIPPLPASACDSTRPYAMQFSPYVPPLGLLAPTAGCAQIWRWARLPRFPMNPVIPTAVVGVGLRDGSAHQAITGAKPQPAVPPMPVAQALPYIDAAVDFILWTYGSDAQALLAAAGLPPVVADAKAQARFWALTGDDAQPVGDWTHFQPYSADWPAIPPANLIGDALSQALADPTQLPALLAGAEKAMNDWVQQQAAPSVGG